MTNIYITRHGQDEDNANGILNGHRDMPLTEIGINQANELAQKIKETRISFTKIYSSPLQRAYKTAEIISKSLDLPKPEKLDLLIERNFGVLTGKEKKYIEILCAPNILKTELTDYFLSAEGAETFPQIVERAKKIIEYIENKHKNESILLVAHGDIGKMLYTDYYHLDWAEVLKTFHFGNSDLVLLSENTLPEDAHIFKCKQFNN